MRGIVLIVTLLALVAPVAPAAAVTGSPEQQLDWVMDVSHRVPVTEAEQREHLSAELIDALGGPAGLDQVLTSVGPLTQARLIERTPESVQAVADERLIVKVHTGNTGLIDGIWFGPYHPSPVSWSELDSRLAALAPRASFSVSLVDNGCRPVHEVDADSTRT